MQDLIGSIAKCLNHSETMITKMVYILFGKFENINLNFKTWCLLMAYSQCSLCNKIIYILFSAHQQKINSFG
jgi:hypothetical protein